MKIAERCNVRSDEVKNVIIWGNHSSTQFPDVAHATVTIQGKEQSVYEAVNNDTWLKGEFVEVIIIQDHKMLHALALFLVPFVPHPDTCRLFRVVVRL